MYESGDDELNLDAWTPRRAAVTRAAVISDSWYPPPAQYWLTRSEEEQRPFRYGDLFNTPASSVGGQKLTRGDGQPWHGVMVLSPSCEVISKAKDDAAIEVARVVPVAAQDRRAAAAIVAGWQEKDGRITVAFAHTVFLAGVPDVTTHADGMFANLKETVRVRCANEAHRISHAPQYLEPRPRWGAFSGEAGA